MVGLLIGLLGLASGGRARRVGRVLEFWGGGVSWLLRQAPIVGGASAMTLGHVVLGQSQQDLDECRTHELVHVRQYERWGPLFIPAYLLSSLHCRLRGRDPYRDNAFEAEAYRDG